MSLTDLTTLQAEIGEANASKGFHDDGARLRAYGGLAAERSYWISRLALITTEVAEAIEELRGGHLIDETYYPTKTLEAPEGAERHKPEGVPSELADVVIRALDLAHEASIDLPAMIAEKLAYNTTRPHLHGKKA